jgi:putative endonuclease
MLLATQRSTLLTLQSLARKLSRRKPRPAHLLLGERGEFEALFYLRDLVAWDPAPGLNSDQATLCFIEVKTRSARDLTPASSAIDDAKRRMLRNMARSFLRTLPRELRDAQRDQILFRFDVVSVYLAGPTPECELVRNAFPWREDRFPG